MEQISDHYPVYKFSKHKGYGTKVHRDAISANGPSHLHRITFCKKLLTTEHMQTHPQATNNKQQSDNKQPPKTFYNSTISSNLPISLEKPKLLLHICCAPDLTRPLHRLKQYFRLYLFRYNPNIHPRQEHTKRYEQFIKLIGLQDGDYEIVEDRYDPKEFFQAMIDQKVSINPALHNASDKEVLKTA